MKKYILIAGVNGAGIILMTLFKNIKEKRKMPEVGLVIYEYIC